MPSVPVSNAGAALGICGLDPDSGDGYAIGLANVMGITTAGTTTVDNQQGAFFGFNVVTLGASATMVAYDITGTSTLALIGTNTATAIGPQGYPGPPGLAVRYAGSLVVVLGGTVGQINPLWD